MTTFIRLPVVTVKDDMATHFEMKVRAKYIAGMNDLDAPPHPDARSVVYFDGAMASKPILCLVDADTVEALVLEVDG